MRKLIIFIFCLFFLSSQAWGATYYIDYDSGSDANNGTTDSTPFKHFPTDSRATDTADSTTIAAGDTIYFAKGVIYQSDATLTTYLFPSIPSGAVGSPITFSAYGTGDDPIITGGMPIDEAQFTLYSGTPGVDAIYRATNSSLGTTGVSANYAFERTNFHGSTIAAGVAHTYWSQGSTDGMGTRCCIYQSGTGASDYIYLRTSDNDTPVGKDLYVFWANYGFYASASTDHHWVFENLDIIGFENTVIYMPGSGSYNGYGLIVQGCDIGHCRKAIESGYTAVHIDECKVHFTWRDPNVNSDSYDDDGNTASLGASNDTDSLLEDSSFIGWENGINISEILTALTIRRNFIMSAPTVLYYPNGSTQREAEHWLRYTNSTAAVQGKPTYAYRNVFFNHSHDALFDNGCGTPTLSGDCNASFSFWNNTIYENRGGDWYERTTNEIYYTDDWPFDGRNNVVIRRILLANGTPASFDPVISWASVNMDYNIYVPDTSPADVIVATIFVADGESHDYTLSQWQAVLLANGAISSEAHSQSLSTSEISNLFQSTTYGDANFLKPKVGGALIDSGTSITTGENGIDKDGNTLTGTFDVGAYEYGAGSTTSSAHGMTIGGGAHSVAVGGGSFTLTVAQ